jgi:hypothetical protein
MYKKGINQLDFLWFSVCFTAINGNKKGIFDVKLQPLPWGWKLKDAEWSMEGVGLRVKNRGCRIESEEWRKICLSGQSYNSGIWRPHAKYQNPRTTPFGRKTEFTPKNIIVAGIRIFLRVQTCSLETEGRMQNPRTTSSCSKVEFTPPACNLT